MKKAYIREMAIALLAAVAVGYAVNAFIGVIAFFVVGALLSKGSVPKSERQRIADDVPETETYAADYKYSYLPSNIHYDG